MRLVARLSGMERDVRRLLDAGFTDDIVEIDYDRVALTIEDDSDPLDEDARWLAGQSLRATVDRLNGTLKLLHGSSFYGFLIERVDLVRDDSERERFGHGQERSGWRSIDDDRYREPPDGLSDVRSLDLSSVGTLALRDIEVARALRLLDLAITPSAFGWSAAYSAWEVVREDARIRNLDPVRLGWWTADERSSFTGTANSVHLLGEQARHGKRFDPPTRVMREQEAFWFLRRVVARWIQHRLDNSP